MYTSTGPVRPSSVIAATSPPMGKGLGRAPLGQGVRCESRGEGVSASLQSRLRRELLRPRRQGAQARRRRVCRPQAQTLGTSQDSEQKGPGPSSPLCLQCGWDGLAQGSGFPLRVKSKPLGCPHLPPCLGSRVPRSCRREPLAVSWPFVPLSIPLWLADLYCPLLSRAGVAHCTHLLLCFLALCRLCGSVGQAESSHHLPAAPKPLPSAGATVALQCVLNGRTQSWEERLLWDMSCFFTLDLQNGQ